MKDTKMENFILLSLNTLPILAAWWTSNDTTKWLGMLIGFAIYIALTFASVERIKADEDLAFQQGYEKSKFKYEGVDDDELD